MNGYGLFGIYSAFDRYMYRLERNTNQTALTRETKSYNQVFPFSLC